MEQPVDPFSHGTYLQWLQERMQSFAVQFPAGEKTDFQRHFQQALEELKKSALKHEPTWLLSSLAFDHLFASAQDAALPDIYRNKTLEQPHIEFLQALLLGKSRDEYGLLASTNEIEPALALVLHCFSIQRMKSAHEKHGDFGELIGTTQLHTMAVRNPAYPVQTLEVIKGLYSPLDDRFAEQWKFRAVGLAKMLMSSIKLIENRISDELNSTLIPVLRAKSLNDIEGISKDNPLLEPAEKTLSLAREQGWTMEAYRHMYTMWWKLRLVDLMTLSPQDLVDCYPGSMSRETATALLDGWSLEFGTKLKSNPEHILMANPIWDRPFIKLEVEKYFLPIGNLVVGFCPRLIWNAICGNKNVHVDLPARKASFLEEALEKLFRANFPAAEIFVNLEWKDETAQGENDIVAVLPPFAFLVEAKSGAIDLKAKRGAPDSLKESIRKLVEEPSNQSSGLIEWIKRNPGKQTVRTKYGELTFDNSSVTEFMQLSVNLEHFCPQASNWQSLSDLGVVSQKSTPVPSVRLTDLYCVFEILNTQSEKLHYWKRRQEIESFAIDGDELGWLKLYLDNRIMFRPTQEFLRLPMLPYYAQSLNAYFLRDESPVVVPKPSISIPDVVAQAIGYAESNKIDGWLQFAFTLLDLWNGQQVILSRLIEGIWQGKGSRGLGAIRYECIEVTTEGEGNLAFCAARGVNFENAPALAAEVFKQDQVSTIFLFACGTEQPLSFVRVFLRNTGFG